MFGHRDRTGEVIEGQDLVGRRTVIVGAGRSNAGRPKLAVRLMASAALVPQKPLDISFPLLYREEWNDNTRSSARYQLLNRSR